MNQMLDEPKHLVMNDEYVACPYFVLWRRNKINIHKMALCIIIITNYIEIAAIQDV